HRIHEYKPAPPPFARYLERGRIYLYDAVPFRPAAGLSRRPRVLLLSHQGQTRREPHRVAIRTARRKDRASRNRVPRCLGPFDFRVRGHYIFSFRGNVTTMSSPKVPLRRSGLLVVIFFAASSRFSASL